MKGFSIVKQKKASSKKNLIFICIIVVCLAAIFILYRQSQKQEENTSSVDLSGITSGDLSSAQNEVDSSLSSEQSSEPPVSSGVSDQLTVSKEDLKKYFKNSVVAGDSITEALELYNYLPANNVVYKRGVSVETAQELFDTAVGLSPENLFLAFGMNDLTYCRGDAQKFVTAYEEQIKSIQQRLPNTKIYINSILPINQTAIDKQPLYGKYPEFNQALQEMCSRLGLVFVDNNSLIEAHPEFYESDGIHVNANYYPLWLQHMAREAGWI